VGVSWDKCKRKWAAQIIHEQKRQFLGSFDDERKAARAFDKRARKLRGADAHGGRAQNGKMWLRLNFPSEREVKGAEARGAVLTEEERAAATALSVASERQRPSAFVGVSWDKQLGKWRATMQHDKKAQHLGSFDDEHEAARAYDERARQLRGADAHGGRAGGTGKTWFRLNLPTDTEVKRAKDRGALPDIERTAARAVDKRARQLRGADA
jgi:hypothetical protein